MIIIVMPVCIQFQWAFNRMSSIEYQVYGCFSGTHNMNIGGEGHSESAQETANI